MTLKPRFILISGVISLTVLITCIIWTKLPSGNNQQQVETVIELPTQTVEEVLANPSPRVARYIEREIYTRDTSNHVKNQKASSNSDHRNRGGKAAMNVYPHTSTAAKAATTPNPHHDEIQHHQELIPLEEIERHSQETIAFYTQALNDFGPEGAKILAVIEQIQADLAAMSRDEILEAASNLKAFYSQYGLDTSPLD